MTMNSMAMFGVPMVGADICGFIDNTTEELCARWIQVGAFSPFSRDHNTVGAAPQELYRWDSVAEASRNALYLRYKLLPHLYTLMYSAHTEGKTVHNALWVHYPGDINTISADSQYMWGNSLLFTPVLDKGAVGVTGYFPKGLWYQLPVGSAPISPLAVIDASEGGMSYYLDTPLDSTNIHVKGGSIIPMQGGGMTTTLSKRSPYHLLVALDSNLRASGRLFLDDGVQLRLDSLSLIEYTFEANTLISRVLKRTYEPEAELGSITIRGLTNWDLHSCKPTVDVVGVSSDTFIHIEDIEVLSAHDLMITSRKRISTIQELKVIFNC